MGKLPTFHPKTQTKMMNKKSSTMEVLLERSHSHFVAQLWLPPLLELHSKEAQRAATNSMLVAGRNPSVRSHKTTKSFGSWLAVKICGLLQIPRKIAESQVSSNMFQSSMKFLKKPQWLEWTESKCENWQVWMPIPGPFDEVVQDNLAVRLLSKFCWRFELKKMVKCVVIAFFHDFHRFFEVVAVLLLICYTKLMLIFEKSW